MHKVPACICTIQTLYTDGLMQRGQSFFKKMLRLQNFRTLTMECCNDSISTQIINTMKTPFKPTIDTANTLTRRKQKTTQCGENPLQTTRSILSDISGPRLQVNNSTFNWLKLQQSHGLTWAAKKSKKTTAQKQALKVTSTTGQSMPSAGMPSSISPTHTFNFPL